MYNSEIKERYISTLTEFASHRAEFIFNLFEPYENRNEKDLSAFSHDEIVEVYENADGLLRLSTLRTNICQISNYKKWAVEQGIGGATLHLAPMGFVKDVSFLDDNIKLNTFANPTHLKTQMNKMFQPESMNTVQCVCRAYLWLIYMGIPASRTADLSVTDVDLNEMVVRLDGYSFDICAEALPSLKKCKELDYFVYDHPSFAKPTKLPREAGDMLLRFTTRGTDRTVRRRQDNKSFYLSINSKISNIRALSNINDEVVPNKSNCYTSGVFYRKFLMETMGFEPDFRDDILLKYLLINKTDVCSYEQSHINRKNTDMKREYEMWKRAHYHTLNKEVFR